MINCFPIIYEDEILYSLLARYRRMCGLINKKNIASDFYNKNKGNIPITFPLNLNLLVKAFPIGSKVNGKELLRNNTLYPFYTSFFNYEKSTYISECMLQKDNVNVAIACGLGGGKVKQNNYLRYCPICVRQDIEDLGESYWRRIHQIIGVNNCYKHKIKLTTSNVLFNDNNNDFVCVDDIYEHNINDSINNYELELNLTYIENVIYLLKNEKRYDLKELNQIYLNMLIDKNLASKNGSIYMKEFLVAFKQYYPQKYLNEMQSDFEIGDKNNWVRLFIRNNGKNRSPLRHLLLIQFLGISAEELFNKCEIKSINKDIKGHNPIYDLNEKKKQWLKLIEENPNVSRSKLKIIGKGLHSYIYKYSKEWYDEVTPRLNKKKRQVNIDWDEKDNELLNSVIEVVKDIINNNGKPIRICMSSIKRALGVRTLNKNKLIKTMKYINEITETIQEYRIRKIRWAIKEMENNNERITTYKVQLKCGFGGNCEENIKVLIDSCLETTTILK